MCHLTMTQYLRGRSGTDATGIFAAVCGTGVVAVLYEPLPVFNTLMTRGARHCQDSARERDSRKLWQLAQALLNGHPSRGKQPPNVV